MSATTAKPAVKYPPVRNYIGGRFVTGQASLLEVLNPSDGVPLSQVPLSSGTDLDAAVGAAAEVWPAWSVRTLKERVQVFYRYRSLLERDFDQLAMLVTEEHGKTRAEAEAEIAKAIELTEFACSLPQIVTGEVQEVSRGVECRTDRHPIGVVASIAPFNFPSMVPHWTFPNAIALGNCLVLKPSELVPLSAGRIAELLAEAGLPAGVFSVVHGGREVVEAICDHPGISAVTFVGSTRVAQLVYRRGSANLKRVLALGGAKNHLLVLPDADLEMTSSNVAASMSGCAGQRCMAASVMVAVGATDHIVRRLVEHARAVVPGHEGGFYVGPTILDHVRPDMAIAREEVFGPVLAIVRAKDVDQALAIENASSYGNAASVYTESGGLARYVTERAGAGMVGVNVGVPVPREPFSFGGWNDSKFGVGDITGRGSIEFWTQSKKMTTKWNREAGTNWMA